MWKLNAPDNSDAMSNIDKAFSYASGRVKHVISSLEKASVQDMYNEYERLRGTPNNVLKASSLRKELRGAFEVAYKEVQKAGRLKHLRSSLFLNARKCPCCGILPVDELDHYLPKSTYQILSIYSSNIVPYCHVCNKHKLASEGQVPEERFIHAYYDIIPEDEQFLFAVVWIQGKGLQCDLEIRKTPGLTDTMVKRLKFQIGRVNLQERIIRELFDFLMPLAFAIKEIYESGGAGIVKSFLTNTANQLKKTYGLNDWHPVIIDALADCNDFCEGGFYQCLALEK